MLQQNPHVLGIISKRPGLFGHAQTAVGVVQESGLLCFPPQNVLLFMLPRPNCLFSSLLVRQSNHLCFCWVPLLVASSSRWAVCVLSLGVRTPLCSLKASQSVPSGSRAPAHSHREVLRALNTGCCHLSASLKRYLANLFGTDPGAAHAATRKGEMHLGKLLPDEFLKALTKKLRQTRLFDNWSTLLLFPLV